MSPTIAMCVLTLLIPRLELYERSSRRPHVDLWHSAGSVAGESSQLGVTRVELAESRDQRLTKRRRPQEARRQRRKSCRRSPRTVSRSRAALRMASGWRRRSMRPKGRPRLERRAELSLPTLPTHQQHCQQSATSPCVACKTSAHTTQVGG